MREPSIAVNVTQIKKVRQKIWSKLIVKLSKNYPTSHGMCLLSQEGCGLLGHSLDQAMQAYKQAVAMIGLNTTTTEH